MTESYAEVLRKLTALDDRAAADRAQAQRWHQEQVAAVQDKVRVAEDTVRAAGQAVRDAQRDLEEVDARAAGLWADFVHRTGPAAERFGRGTPAAAVPRQRDRDAGEYLEEAAASVAYAPPPRPLGGATTVVFGLFGLLGGLTGVAAYQVIRWAGDQAGGEWRTAVPVLALIVLLLGPVLAAAAARRVADRRGVGLTGSAGLLIGVIRASRGF
jgi:hypothetical protein